MKVKCLLSLILVVGLLGAGVVPTYALPNSVKILSQEEIKGLSDENLKTAYVDALIELEAETVFYQRSGFLQKDLNDYRNLIRYRVNLMYELQNRKIEVPAINPK